MNKSSGDGFYAACNALLPTAFEQCQVVFSWLPLAALLEQEGTLPVLVLHGGIGDGSWDVRDIEAHAPRPWADPNDPASAAVPGWMFNMLWSDPSDTDAVSQMGVHPSSRGAGRIVRFGEDVTRTFCARNGLGLIVRSHEMAQEGYKVQHSGRLVTVFSARNYTGALANDSAILLFARDGDGNLRMRAKKLEHWRSEQALAAQAATRSISPIAAALLAAARGGGGGGGMAGGRGGRP
jgi:diadenosine tetraphosphatase ApaH/serine/threonine PP2A family protein phosphatase